MHNLRTQAVCTVFVGEISNEKGSMRMVGFIEDQQRKIAQHEGSEQVISLEKLIVKSRSLVLETTWN